MTSRDARGRPFEPASDQDIRAWRRSHPDAASVLDMLLQRAGRDARGNIVGTVDDHGLAVASAHAAAGVCYACAFDLAGLDFAPDGSIICPECGHTWHLSNEPPAASNTSVDRMERTSLISAAMINPIVLLWRFFWPEFVDPRATRTDDRSRR